MWRQALRRRGAFLSADNQHRAHHTHNPEATDLLKLLAKPHYFAGITNYWLAA